MWEVDEDMPSVRLDAMTEASGINADMAEEWIEAPHSEWVEQVDRVSVELRFKASAGADDADEVWWINTYGSAWSRAWLADQLAQLAVIGHQSGLSGDVLFDLDARDRRTEWGASGAVYEVVLTLSENLLSDAMWLVLGALGDRLATRLKEKRAGWSSDEDDLTDQRAREAALAAVQRLRGITRDGLDVRSVESLGRVAVLVGVRETATGAGFTVRVEAKSGGVFVGRVQKVIEP